MLISDIMESIEETAKNNSIDLSPILLDIQNIIDKSLTEVLQTGYAEGHRAGVFMSGGYMTQEDLDAYRDDSIRAFKRGFQKSLGELNGK